MKKYEIAVQRELNVLYQDVLDAIRKGKAVRVEVKSLSSKTKEQSGYYWGLMLPRIQQGMKEHGNELSLDEINKFLNDRFFSVTKTVIIKKGIDEHAYTIREPRSKSGASVDEMSEFIERVIRWASVDLGVYIPSPNEEAPF